jgi:hypothetical protein
MYKLYYFTNFFNCDIPPVFLIYYANFFLRKYKNILLTFRYEQQKADGLNSSWKSPFLNGIHVLTHKDTTN